jgi:hypothetical protein
MAHGDVEFESEADPSSKPAWWLKSEVSPNLSASSPVTTSVSVTTSAVQTQAPNTKVSPRLKAMVGLK